MSIFLNVPVGMNVFISPLIDEFSDESKIPDRGTGKWGIVEKDNINDYTKSESFCYLVKVGNFSAWYRPKDLTIFEPSEEEKIAAQNRMLSYHEKRMWHMHEIDEMNKSD